MTESDQRQAPAGWYVNAHGQHQWWDGFQWGPVAPYQPLAAHTNTLVTIPFDRAPEAVKDPILAHPFAASSDTVGYSTISGQRVTGLKTSGAAYAFLILIGGTGAHRFYLGQIGHGLRFLIPALVLLALNYTGPETLAQVVSLAFLVMWVVEFCILNAAVRKYNLLHFGRPF